MRDIATRPSEAVERSLYPAIGLYIDGEWIYDREAWGQVRNPSTETVLGPVPKATAEDLDRALRAAEQGFRLWRDTPPARAGAGHLAGRGAPAAKGGRHRQGAYPRERQDARCRRGRDRPLRQLLRVGGGPVATQLWPCGARRARNAEADPASADRTGCGLHAVERPHELGRAQDLGRSRRRLLSDPETRRRHPRDCLRARALLRRRGAPAGRAEPRPWRTQDKSPKG